MLTIDDLADFNDYKYNQSPDSGLSFTSEYLDHGPEDDFLTQLSSDLDIPFLLNPTTEDNMNGIYNSILDQSTEEILSEITASPSPRSESQDSEDILDTLLKEIKCEPIYNSSSPTPSHSSHGSDNDMKMDFKEELETPPISPSDSNITASKPLQIRFVHRNNTNKSIQYQNTPYTKVNINNGKDKSTIVANNKKTVTKKPNVVVLEHLRAMPISAVKLPVTVPKLPLPTLAKPQAIPKTVINSGSITGFSNINSINGISIPIIATQPVSQPIVKPVSLPNGMDAKALKRQQRMIKNRESANLSRKKKKEHLMQLEHQVAELMVENEKLKLENAKLKERLSSVISKRMINGVQGKNATKGIIVCMFLFTVCFNIDYFRSPLTNNDRYLSSNIKDPPMGHHNGRHLLWEEAREVKNKTIAFERNATRAESGTSNDDKSKPPTPLLTCPTPSSAGAPYFNQTESVRLAAELHRWIGKPYNTTIEDYFTSTSFPSNVGDRNVNDSASTSTVKMAKRRKSKSKAKLRKLQAQQAELEKYAPSSLYNLKKKREEDIPAAAGNELQLFEPSEFAEFFAAINRKDDTFYVVSFSPDHLLLPALNHNKTRRPKMSLIFPAVLANDTEHSPQSQVSLMQIDCEVLDTRMINIRSGAIPLHLRNHTTHESPAQHDKNVSDSSSASSAQPRPRPRPDQDAPYQPYFMKNTDKQLHHTHSNISHKTGYNKV